MMGDGCIAHEHDRLVPLVLVPVRLPARGGPPDGPGVWLCANAAATVYDLLERIEGFASAGAQATAREVVAALPARWLPVYPGRERLVAYRIWLTYGDAVLRGSLDRELRSWHPDGRSKISGLPDVADLDTVASWPRRLRRRLARL